MKPRNVVLIVVFMLLVAGAGTLYAWSARPQIVSISPSAGTENVATTSSIRLIFSRSMDHASVISHLSITPASDGTYRWDENSLVFTPNQPWPAGQTILLRLDPGARAASWLAFPLGDQSWSFATREIALAYLWPSTGQANLYTIDPLTGSIRQYTSGMDVQDYTASPDGKEFYFSATNAQGGTDLYCIDRIEADIPTPQPYQAEKLLDCGAVQCRNPAVSTNGQAIAYEKLLPTAGGGQAWAQIWTMSFTDRIPAPIGQADHETVQPAWSSTGLLAYYDRTISAYEIYNPVTRQRLELPNQTGQPGAWSPDGADYLAPEITYQPANGSHETGSSHLIRYQVQGNSTKDISGKDSVEDVEAIYSPKGESIAFTRKFLDASRWSPGRQIWIMSSDGLNSHPITNEPGYNHYDLAWGLDGHSLAYVRFNQETISDPPELWMITTDGTHPLQLVIGGYSPLWVP